MRDRGADVIDQLNILQHDGVGQRRSRELADTLIVIAPDKLGVTFKTDVERLRSTIATDQSSPPKSENRC